MDLVETLKSEGWYLTEEGIKKIPENIDKSDLQNVRKWALDMDFREIAGGALPQDISKKDDSIKGKIVLQISKIRNLSAPKANEESYAGAPKFLQIELTDGVNQIIGLEMENLPDVSLSTPPGTKIYLKMEKIPLMQGWLMLSYQNMKVIGGKVPALIEKWELNRALQKCAKSGRMNTGSSGPPPWIPFGQKIQSNISNDKNFKSLNASKDKENKTNNEFDTMRSEAIAEAAKTGKRKVFGGGQQQMVDHNVKKIMEKGYSEDQAKYALKATRNNLERALFNLKRRDEYKNKEEFIDKTRGPKRVGKDSKKAKSEEVVASKPAGNVSLFDYLTDKLPVTETTNDKPVAASKNERPPQKYNNYNDTPKPQSAAQPQRSQSQQPQSFQQNNASNNTNNASRPKFENNISSSFANRNTNNGPSDQLYGGSERQRDYNANRNRPPRDGPGQYNNSSNQYGSSQRDSGDKYRGNTRNVKDRNQRMPERNSNYQNQSNYHSSNNYESQPRYNRNNNNTNNKNDNNRKNYENSGGSNSGPNRYQQREGNNMNNQSQSSKPYHENRPNSYGGNNEKINKLAESTAKMRIENAKTPPSGRNSHIASMAISGGNQQQSHSHHQSHQQQHQGQHQQHQPQAQQILQPPQTGLMQNNYNPMPNGFAYDPSKIMGFRSKEANEFAMSVLKNQSPAQIPPTVVPQQAHYPPPMQIPQQAYPPPAQFLMQPQHAQPPPPPAFAVNQFGDWDWKIGDRCLAKYWDDGRFYEAEITNLSENTCVVLFIEYGNHEEVLKTDCIPITDSQHRTINYSKMNEINNPHHHQTVRGVGGRYRGERQVYVPPPKREA